MAAELQNPSPGVGAEGDPPRHPGARDGCQPEGCPASRLLPRRARPGTAHIGLRRARAEGVGYLLPLRVGRPRLAGEVTAPAIEGRLVGELPRVASSSAG